MIKWLLMTSLTGSIASLLLIVLRTKMAGRFGGRSFYYACLLALLLFVLPLQVNVPAIQIKPFLASFEEGRSIPSPAIEETTAVVDTPMPDQVIMMSTKTNNVIFPTLSIDQWVLGIWIFGCVAMMFRYFFGYYRFKKQVIRSHPIDTMGSLRVVVSDYVHSPMLIGFFKPQIVIPNTEINVEDYNLALQHEWIHYKQRDVWFKLVAVMVNCLHWFNPVSYLALANISEACEYSVDEKITKGLKSAEKRRYSEMLLHFASSKSPVLNSSLALHKKQLYRRFTLIMKRNTGKGKVVLGFMLVVVIGAVSVFSSSVVFAKNAKPLKEYGGAIKTYYNTNKKLEENVQVTLGDKATIAKVGWSHTDAPLYIDADGLKIDYFNRTESQYQIVKRWLEKETATANLTNKTLSIAGQKVTVAFRDQAKNYMDDKVINQMIINQITYELDNQNPKLKYDHKAFIHELIKRGAYVIEEVVSPEHFTYERSRTPNGGFIGNKRLTSYDKKDKIVDIFNGKASIPKMLDNEDANQGVQLGAAFVIKSGETLAINIKELTDTMPTLSLAIIDETTGELVKWLLHENSGSRNIFTPGDNEGNHSFKVMASGEEQDKARIEIYTFKTGEMESGSKSNLDRNPR
ncbi:M56 family metallopeptidase [Cohnella sp. WQ 127256]|uniref:M56 family metallopeptidase n=1 Tax=Cohnella sp. WQ 127256 TaxID=2938790 RepID=UPI002118B2C3|nr:M56 family metallopeptidase [Cohnella sp. WQ 127256]